MRAGFEERKIRVQGKVRGSGRLSGLQWMPDGRQLLSTSASALEVWARDTSSSPHLLPPASLPPTFTPSCPRPSPLLAPKLQPRRLQGGGLH
eukprot:3937836-Rhodomonas_salina.1